MRFQWWPTVLLEWNPNLAAKICSVDENFLKCNFLQIFFFPITFLPVARKKTLLTQKISCMIYAFRNCLMDCKNPLLI